MWFSRQPLKGINNCICNLFFLLVLCNRPRFPSGWNRRLEMRYPQCPTGDQGFKHLTVISWWPLHCQYIANSIHWLAYRSRTQLEPSSFQQQNELEKAFRPIESLLYSDPRLNGDPIFSFHSQTAYLRGRHTFIEFVPSQYPHLAQTSGWPLTPTIAQFSSQTRTSTICVLRCLSRFPPLVVHLPRSHPVFLLATC